MSPVIRTPTTEKHPHLADAPTHVIISPSYTELPHQLDLRTLDVQEQLVALALMKLRCLREDYAIANYVDIFNWHEVALDLREQAATIGHEWKAQRFFIVAFRSQVPSTCNTTALGDLDKYAHSEAVKSGGFLKYWYGTPDTEGRNLATCIWRTRDDARKSAALPAHCLAANSARGFYTAWKIERLALVFDDEVKDWRIEEWAD